MTKIINDLKNYTPVNEQEKKDIAAMLTFLEGGRSCFYRENIAGHMTASAWIVNRDRTKTLFCYHKLYDSWSWIGGHADGDTDLLQVALKEAREETGVNAVPVSGDILSVEILTVSGHMKKGEYIPGHLHYNVTYLLEADENAPLKIAPEENSALRWLCFDEIKKASTEKWMVDRVYAKLIAKGVFARSEDDAK